MNATHPTTPRVTAAPPAPLLSLAMKMGAPLVVAGATAVSLAATPVPDAAAPTDAVGTTATPVIEQTQKYDDAMHALRAQRYSAAYGRFAALADQGHAPSALMALAMVTYRPTLVDREWSATPAQLRRWTDLAMDEVRARSRVIAKNDRSE